MFTIPSAHIWDLKLTTELDDGLLQGCAPYPHPDPGGLRLPLPPLRRGSGWWPRIPGWRTSPWRWEGPKLWSAEKPHLYRLEIAVRDQDGAVAETVTETVGFRGSRSVTG